MSSENEKNRAPDIDLPLASDQLTLSHHKGGQDETPTVSKPASPPAETKSAARPEAPAQKPAAPANGAPGDKKTAPAERVKVCPKCAHRQNDFYACRRCGLVFRNWRPEMERELFTAVSDAVYVEAQQMWRGLEDNWESDEAHEKFIQYCKAGDAVSYAVRAYRLYAARNPADARAADNARKCSEFMGSMLQLMTPQTRAFKSSTVTPGQITLAVSIGVLLLIIVFILFDYMLK